MSLKDRMAKVLNEPDYQGEYLKPDKVKVGDMIKVESVEIQPAKEIQTGSGPAQIPERVVVTGGFRTKGQTQFAETVKASLSKGSEKALFGMWGDNWVGKTMMVHSIERKNIKGRDTTWIVWTGLP